MGILLTLILGGLAGYIASLLLNRNESMGVLANIVVGILGAFIANIVLAPLFGMESRLSDPTWGGFALAIGGSIILLAIVNLVTRRSIR